MKIGERVSSFIQPVKTSFGTARTKASETVAKASEIAKKILKVLFTPVTYLYNHAKSFYDKYDKMRNQHAHSDAPAPAEIVPDADSTGAEVLPASAVSVSADDTSLDVEIGSAIRGLFTEPDADSTVAVEDDAEPVETSYLPLEQEVFENPKAEILGTDKNAAAVKIQKLLRGYVAQKRLKAENVKTENYQAEWPALNGERPNKSARRRAHSKQMPFATGE